MTNLPQVQLDGSLDLEDPEVVKAILITAAEDVLSEIASDEAAEDLYAKKSPGSVFTNTLMTLFELMSGGSEFVVLPDDWQYDEVSRNISVGLRIQYEALGAEEKRLYQGVEGVMMFGFSTYLRSTKLFAAHWLKKHKMPVATKEQTKKFWKEFSGDEAVLRYFDEWTHIFMGPRYPRSEAGQTAWLTQTMAQLPNPAASREMLPLVEDVEIVD